MFEILKMFIGYVNQGGVASLWVFKLLPWFQSAPRVLKLLPRCGKEFSLCHKLCFSKPNIFGFQCRRPQIFQIMNSVISNNLSLTYQRFTTLGSKDIRIIFRVFNKDSIPLSEFCEKFYENRKWKKGSCFTFFSLIVYI